MGAASRGRTHVCTRPNSHRQQISLARRGPFSNRSTAVKSSFIVARPGHGSLRGQRELPQHLVRSGSAGIARSTTGLRLITCPRPRPRNCLHPRPGATRLSVSCGRVSMRYAAVVSGAQRNGSPDRQTLCRITDNLRAKATRALPGPERCAMAAAQSFRCSDRLTR